MTVSFASFDLFSFYYIDGKIQELQGDFVRYTIFRSFFTPSNQPVKVWRLIFLQFLIHEKEKNPTILTISERKKMFSFSFFVWRNHYYRNNLFHIKDPVNIWRGILTGVLYSEIWKKFYRRTKISALRLGERLLGEYLELPISRIGF